MSEVERGPDPGGEKLLVVDDDPFIARLLEIELAAAGYQVRVANDGEQAIQLVQQDADLARILPLPVFLRQAYCQGQESEK